MTKDKSLRMDIGPLRLKRDWAGLIVRLRIPITSVYGDMYRKGSEWFVTYSHKGLHLNKKPCANCGTIHRLRQIPERDVEVIRRVRKASNAWVSPEELDTFWDQDSANGVV